MITDGVVLTTEEVDMNVEKDRSKRTKKDGAVSSLLGSAGSQGGPVREQ